MPTDEPTPQSEDEIRAYAREKATQSVVNFRSNEAADREYQEAIKQSGPYLTLGIQLGLSIGVFCAIGYFIDKSQGTSPRWLGIMAGVGSVLSLVYFIVTVLRLSQKDETKAPKK